MCCPKHCVLSCERILYKTRELIFHFFHIKTENIRINKKIEFLKEINNLIIYQQEIFKIKFNTKCGKACN